MTDKLLDHISQLFHRRQRRNVALVLGGGGARGLAHIGAIEVLLEEGYAITSIAGTSMGALVGAVYAAGKMPELKKQLLCMKRKQILSLMDISLGLDHIATGERLMTMLHDLTGDMNIENLSVPYCCCASDIVSGKERVFDRGPVNTAVRASISIPGFFAPLHIGEHIYVDGSVHNTLPLDRVCRTKGDILIAVNACGPDSKPLKKYCRKHNEDSKTYTQRIRRLLPDLKSQLSENYLNLALRTARMAIQNNTQMALRLTPPEICVQVPMDSFDIFDFDKAADIIRFGREAMTQQINEYKKKR